MADTKTTDILYWAAFAALVIGIILGVIYGFYPASRTTILFGSGFVFFLVLAVVLYLAYVIILNKGVLPPGPQAMGYCCDRNAQSF